jgi:hypothetical protein
MLWKPHNPKMPTKAVLRELDAKPDLDSPSGLWMWWRSIKNSLPSWYTIAKVLVLLQPSSASIERFFALLKANSSAQQNNESREILAARSMALYNQPKE